MLNFKIILLKKFDRILNPKWTNKFIISLLSLGSMLVISPILATIVDVSFSNSNIEFGLAFSKKTNTIWDFLTPIVGVLFVIVSIVLFWKKQTTKTSQNIKLFDVYKDGLVEFYSIEDPETHTIFSERKDIIKIDYYNPSYNYKHKQIVVNGIYPQYHTVIYSDYIKEFPKILQLYVQEIIKTNEKDAGVFYEVLDNNDGTKDFRSRLSEEVLIEFRDGVRFIFTSSGWGDFRKAYSSKLEERLNLESW